VEVGERKGREIMAIGGGELKKDPLAGNRTGMF